MTLKYSMQYNMLYINYTKQYIQRQPVCIANFKNMRNVHLKVHTCDTMDDTLVPVEVGSIVEFLATELTFVLFLS